MNAIAFAQFRKHLTELVDEINDSGEPLTVTRADGRDFVMLSAREFESMRETMHLMSTAANAENLRASIQELESGQGVERSID
ncbi:MAG: type II toxin-antitoxin system prevent-host-death family antitoxin [Sulfuricella sp.]|nr:type II toxin-antitoxin system prevent-host-death family antitoxin [Sulfuricella sp.]